MILTSHQPNFLPYMGFFYKIYRSEIFVLSDDVYFSKKGMHNWNIIKVKNGSQKITIPVNAHHDTRLCDVMISEPKSTLPKIVRTLEETYAKTKYFNEGQEITNIINDISTNDKVPLVFLNIAIIKYILKRMGIDRTIVISTKDLHITGNKDDRIINMCKEMKADIYYSGMGAKKYHENKKYKENNIRLIYSDYKPVVYHQKYGSFISNMSIIDYIFNNGYKLPEDWS